VSAEHNDFPAKEQVTMSVSNSSGRSRSCKPPKPAKPRPDFPLFPHACGQWVKKIRGKLHYFGKWDDPQAALDKYLTKKDALHAGRRPREATEGVTIKVLVNAYLNSKQARLDAGELSPLTMQNAKQATDLIVFSFGKTRLAADIGPDDFGELRASMAKRWGPVRVRDMIQRVRSVFKYGSDCDLLDRPARFGPDFRRPSRKTIRLEKLKHGPKLFTADEIRKVLDVAQTPMRAIILLGINCAYGNADCGRLQLKAVDLEKGIIDYARPKTGIDRRCCLWPETIEAMRESLAKRPDPKGQEDAGLFFVTRCGDSWAKEVSDSPITKEMRKLLNQLGINGRRNFYVLRHTFRTIADGARDKPAADFIMGHEGEHISAQYLHGISDERLRAVTDHVHTWLFGGAGA
jgi:integrase